MPWLFFPKIPLGSFVTVLTSNKCKRTIQIVQCVAGFRIDRSRLSILASEVLTGLTWRTLSARNRASTQDSHIVGLHSPQFPLGVNKHSSEISTSCLLETIIHLLLLLYYLNAIIIVLFILLLYYYCILCTITFFQVGW